MAIFVTMTRFVVMANMIKLAIIAAIEYYQLASNLGVLLMKNKNADQTQKQLVN